MIASLHKSIVPSTARMSVCALAFFAVAVTSPLAAQETAAQQEAENQPAAAAAQQPVANQADAEKARRERYYLGERPRLKRQEGPAVGKPKSIIPKPFVPKGSVVVPPAPVATPTTEEGTGDLTDGALSVDASAIAEADELLPEDIQNNTQTDMLGEQVVEAGVLEQLDPSGLGLLSEGESYSPDFWADYDRSKIAEGYAAYEKGASSGALTTIARKIAMSRVVLPSPAGNADILAVIQARLSLLTSLGDSEGYIALLERLPVDRDWSALVKDFTNKHLLKGELVDACAVAAAERASDTDPYWLRLAAFCEAARGNRVGVDFQLGILEEVSEIRPTFYQLIDQILVEASQAPGTVIPEAAALSNSLQVDLLEATMARLARAKVPLLALDGVNPLAVEMMLSLPGVSAAAKIELMGLAARQGWLEAESLTAFALNHQLETGDMEAALGALDGDRRFVIDAALFHLSSQADAGEIRTNALDKLWQRSVGQGIVSKTAGGYVGVTQDIIPSAEANSMGIVLARAALLSGDKALAQRWFTALRSTSAGDADIDRVLLSLAPLVAVAGGEGAPEMTDQQLSAWWQAQADRDDKFERANLLFTVLEALGIAVADESWQWLDDGPAAFDGKIPSVSLWRRYLIAVAEKDTPQALALSFGLMVDGGPAEVPAALAGSLVAGLMELGLEEEARLIATEMLIGHGL